VEITRLDSFFFPLWELMCKRLLELDQMLFGQLSKQIMLSVINLDGHFSSENISLTSQC
jgi:hypothetical protein